MSGFVVYSEEGGHAAWTNKEGGAAALTGACSSDSRTAQAFLARS